MSSSFEKDSVPSVIGKIECFVNSISCPPESVYYAAEYLRLQIETDKWKRKADNSEVDLEKVKLETMNTKANILKDCEIKFREKLKKEKEKVYEFYENKLKLLRNKNWDLKSINEKNLHRIKVLTSDLENSNKIVRDIQSERSNLKASLTENENHVKRLQSTESQLHESLNDLKAQLLLKDSEINGYKNEISKNKSQTDKLLFALLRSKVFRRKYNALKQQQVEMERERNNNILETQTVAPLVFINNELNEHDTYQPISSPVTPTFADENMMIEEMQSTNQSGGFNSSEIMPAAPGRSGYFGEHYEIFATVSQEHE